MKRDKRRLFTFLILLGLLFLFAFVLKSVESAGSASGDGSGITTWWKALWYLVVTLTTVGYGDFVPQTFWGKAIGALFLFCSVGLFSWIIGLVVSLLNGDFLPCLRLKQLRKKRWYLFSDDGPRCSLLAKKLSDEDSDAVFILCQSKADVGQQFREKGNHQILFVPMEYEECLEQRKQRLDQVFLFLLSDDGWDNYLSAKSAAEMGCHVYCRTSARPDAPPKEITLFSDTEAIGRLFWMEHPLTPGEKEIVIIGGKRYGEPLLEKGLLNNIFAPDQHLIYHVFGDFAHFKGLHEQLKNVMKINGEGAGGDSLWLHEEPWENRSDLLEQADRIVICADSDDEGLELYWTLKTYCPLRGKVFVRLSRMVKEAGMVVFGSDEELYEPENVMNRTLVSLGIRVNDLYRTKFGGKTWEELSEFHRQSSIASADHLAVKASILLGETLRGRLTQEDSRRAFEVYRQTAERDHELYRSIEHMRWNRFHTMYNWRYDEKRDNAMRRHTLLLPYDKLSLRDQEKDDDAWLLLDEYAKGNL